MDSARFSDDVSFDMNSFPTPVTPNGLEYMLMARLETRAAVLETELRHAKEEKQNAHLANQALLQLLVLHSSNVSVAQAKLPDPTLIAERKQHQNLKQECRRLRMQCSRLRRPAIIARSSQVQYIKELHQAVASHSVQSTSQSTPTVSSSETFVASQSNLRKDKDDFDVEIEQENVVEITTTPKNEYDELDEMDDADTYAPWKFIACEDVPPSKPQFVQRFISTQTEPKVEDIAEETILLVHKKSGNPGGLGLSVPTQARVRTGEEAFRTVKEVEVVTSRQELPITAISANVKGILILLNHG